MAVFWFEIPREKNLDQLRREILGFLCLRYGLPRVLPGCTRRLAPTGARAYRRRLVPDLVGAPKHPTD